MMLDEINDFRLLDVPRKKTRYVVSVERPNYKDGWTYCNHCKQNMEKDSIRCTICNKPVRHAPIAKKRGLKRY